MHNITPPEWAIPERHATPEAVFLNRRQWLAAAGASVGALASTSALALPAPESTWSPKPPTAPAYTNAGRAITEHAKENAIDCIVVASHRPGLQDIFIGSTADWVVRHAPCSVHVVR